jgi:16S rRNA (cytosine1402-N4)-methyltransferase
MSPASPGHDATQPARARHAPVLLAEVVSAMAPTAGARLLDGTFGAGGYTRALLAAADGVRVLALDRDPGAIAGGYGLVAEAGGRLKLVEATFGDLATEAVRADFAPLDGVVLDIGVSSMQLDQPERGFSFRADGPLDMRMALSGESAADLVNEADEHTLADIIFHYGEERRARAVARAILEARRQAPIMTTSRLAEIVASVVRGEPGGIHPATRTFQALRIAVNDELGELARALHGAETVLRPGGRLAVVSFHSLEDRIVKQFLQRRSGHAGGGFSRFEPAAGRNEPTFSLAHRGVIGPTDAEVAANPRARSAKLRVAIRNDAPPREADGSVMALASLPETAARLGTRARRPAPDELRTERRGRR